MLPVGPPARTRPDQALITKRLAAGLTILRYQRFPLLTITQFILRRRILSQLLLFAVIPAVQHGDHRWTCTRLSAGDCTVTSKSRKAQRQLMERSMCRTPISGPRAPL